MPIVKYDVSKATAGGDWEHVQPGLYIMKIVQWNIKDSKAGNPMWEIVLNPLAEADGTKLDGEYNNLWHYVLTDGSQDSRLRAMTDAIGEKPKGRFNTDDHINDLVLVSAKSDKDQDGDYRPRVAKVLPVPDEVDAEADEDEEEEVEEEDEGVDLAALSRSELKKLIKDNELEIRVLKSMSDDDIRAAITEALSTGEEEDDEEEDDEEEEEADNGYDEMSIQDLKNALKERGLSYSGKKAALVSRLEEDDAKSGDPF